MRFEHQTLTGETRYVQLELSKIPFFWIVSIFIPFFHSFYLIVVIFVYSGLMY